MKTITPKTAAAPPEATAFITVKQAADLVHLSEVSITRTGSGHGCWPKSETKIVNQQVSKDEARSLLSATGSHERSRPLFKHHERIYQCNYSGH